MNEDMDREIVLSHGTLGANQIAALRALIEDIGVATYRQSRLFSLVVSRRIEDAADEFMAWVYVDGQESPKLWARRSDQQRLFLLEAF